MWHPPSVIEIACHVFVTSIPMTNNCMSQICDIHPVRVKPTKICTCEELATAIKRRVAHTHENLTHANIASTKICTFTIATCNTRVFKKRTAYIRLPLWANFANILWIVCSQYGYTNLQWKRMKNFLCTRTWDRFPFPVNAFIYHGFLFFLLVNYFLAVYLFTLSCSHLLLVYHSCTNLIGYILLYSDWLDIFL